MTAAPARDLAELPTAPNRYSSVLDLNRLKVKLTSNVENFSAASYFTRFSAPGTAVDFEIRCIDLDRDDLDPAGLRAAADRSVRAQRFAKGYYRGPYFGDPAFLITRGRTFHVYGRRLERLVWPYFVKYVLAVFAAEQGYLDVKAGGFVLPDGRATLLFGQTGGGKSVFLAEACRDGARFLTNTHALVQGTRVHGVPSAIRARPDASFRGIDALAGTVRHLEDGEYLLDPEQLFDQPPADSAEIANIVIVNRRSPQSPRFERIPAETALAFVDQFGLGVTAYGLKDDLLAHFDHDLTAYAAHYQRLKTGLAEICCTATCYTSNADLTQPAQRAAVLSTLRGGSQ